MNWKEKTCFIIVIIAVVFIVLTISSGSNIIIKEKYNSIKDIAKNCEDYVGKIVSIKGTIVLGRIWSHVIQDNEGYWIEIEAPPYRTLNRGEIYILTGTINYEKRYRNSGEFRCYIEVT